MSSVQVVAPGRASSGEADGVDGGEEVVKALPGFALVDGGPEVASGGAHGKDFGVGGDFEGVTIGDVVGLAGGFDVVCGAGEPAVSGLGDDEAGIEGDARGVLNGGDEPGGVGFGGVDGDGEAEGGGAELFDGLPGFGAVGGFEDAGVVLDPESVGVRWGLDHAVGVLDGGFFLLIGGHVAGDHAFGLNFPGEALIAGAPDAGAGDGD